MGPTPGLVSIITPCHNAAPFIGETIHSVMAQTYPEIEHIVVDDGSQDESWKIISSFAERVSAIQLAANRGGSYARNRGADSARGEFLMFLDADDRLTPETIAALVLAVQDQPRTVATCSWRRLKQREDSSWMLAPAGVPFPEGDPLAGWLAGDSWIPPCAVLWRRDAYQCVQSWDETITANDDGDLMMRAFLVGVRLVRTDGGEAHYRWHGHTRVSLGRGSFTATWFQSHMRVLEKVTRELQVRGMLAQYLRPLGIAYHRLALLGFQHGQVAEARECLQRGRRYAGHFDHSRTPVGRLLTRTLGLERKERLAALLAKLGIMSEGRRRDLMLQASYRRQAGLEGKGKLRILGSDVHGQR